MHRCIGLLALLPSLVVAQPLPPSPPPPPAPVISDGEAMPSSDVVRKQIDIQHRRAHDARELNIQHDKKRREEMRKLEEKQ